MSAKGRPERELRPLGGQRSGASRKRGGTITSVAVKPARPFREGA